MSTNNLYTKGARWISIAGKGTYNGLDNTLFGITDESNETDS